MRRPSPYHYPMSPNEPALRAAEAAWAELRDLVEARAQAICAEVRRYPTPIAACDVQLTELIERRARALERCRAMGEASTGDAGTRASAMSAFLCGPGAGAGGPEEERLCERLRAALRGMMAA
jgi:hypothetical protein